MKKLFRNIANSISIRAGSATTFLFAILLIVIWASSGPSFGYSDTWQLIINTGTTIVTFLMVFLIQNTQNRNDKAMQLKLDELIRATKARDAFVGLEGLTEDELSALENEFQQLHEKQATSRVMKKLHANIEAEHARRLTFRSSFNTLTGHIFSEKKNQK